MIAVLQRVTRSWVEVEGKIVGSISRGLNILLGVEKGDSEEDIKKLVNKILKLRIFKNPESGKDFDLCVTDIGGEILVVSQFTLLADCRKGRRPSFDKAEKPQRAKELYEEFVEKIKRESNLKVETGIFGADMKVYIENEGPVTIILNSKEL
jgi:D-tyrosyl-tRNA(Tyr) deacylase